MNRFTLLFQRFITGRSTEEEKNELFDLIARSENDAALKELIDSEIVNMSEEIPVPEQKAERVLHLILQTSPAAKKRSRIRPLFYWSAAAVLLLAMGLLAFFSIHHKTPQQPVVAKASATAILPATQGAVLTLADGSAVVLDSARNGAIAHQSGTQVNLQNGQVVYDARKAQAMQYNTLATPRGQVFELILPDGSAVWLNAASRIKYPTSFTGDERVVELTGEAYFEVAKQQQPFIVKTVSPNGSSHEVKVLGTHFNVSAYEDEDAVRTTLLEGKVAVSTEGSKKDEVRNTKMEVVLKPGQQSIARFLPATSHSPLAINYSPNIDQVMSWKNGIFNFENADLRTVMRQLERWYNIEVVYEEGVPNLVFGGKMGRNLTLANLLRILQLSKVHFRLEPGNRLVVMP